MIIDGGPEGFIRTSLTMREYFGHDKSIVKEDKMDTKITAQWARETAESNLSDKCQAELKECERHIKDAISQNNMSTTIYGLYGLQRTIKELESRGFKVRQDNTQIDGSSLTIAW